VRANLQDFAVLILSLGVAACLVIAFAGAVFGHDPIGQTAAYLLFTAFGGVIGILASRLSGRHGGDE